MRRRYITTGKITEGRIVWLNIVSGQFVLLRGSHEEQEATQAVPEWGTDYRLYFPRPGTKPVSINLTALTTDELHKFREFLNIAFDLAEPVVAQRDRIAQDAFNEGDDSFARSYRQIPQLVIREGAVGQDDEGVYFRPDDLPSGDESGRGEVGDLRVPDGGVRGAGDELASGEPSTPESEDDEPQAD